MKNVVGLFVFVLLFSSVATARQRTPPSPRSSPASQCRASADAAALQQVIDRWKQSYNDGDAARVAALYAEDAYYLTQHYVTGIVHGRAAIQAYIQLGVGAHYRIDSIRMLSADCSGDFAYVITRYDADNAGQKVFGVNVVVLKRTRGKWLIVAHEAAVPDPGTAIQHLDTSAGK